jgi:hypothetical protein
MASGAVVSSTSDMVGLADYTHQYPTHRCSSYRCSLKDVLEEWLGEIRVKKTGENAKAEAAGTFTSVQEQYPAFKHVNLLRCSF